MTPYTRNTFLPIAFAVGVLLGCGSNQECHLDQEGYASWRAVDCKQTIITYFPSLREGDEDMIEVMVTDESLHNKYIVQQVELPRTGRENQ